MCRVQELLELEFQLDEPARARQQQWQHLAWRKLVQAGVAYRDLFRVRLTDNSPRFAGIIFRLDRII